MPDVHIGDAARLTGLTVDTIRFYHKTGILSGEGRTAGGYRTFDGAQIRDLKFIRHAQALGFTLDEIRQLLDLRQKRHACPEVRSMLRHKLGDVQGKIKALVRLESELKAALRECNRRLRQSTDAQHDQPCPALENLERINGKEEKHGVAGKRAAGKRSTR